MLATSAGSARADNRWGGSGRGARGFVGLGRRDVIDVGATSLRHAPRRGIRSCRTRSTIPVAAFGAASASPASTARAASSASIVSGLPRRRRRCRFGRLTSTTSTPSAPRWRVSPAPQHPVLPPRPRSAVRSCTTIRTTCGSRSRWSRSCQAQHPAQLVDRGGDVNVLGGVHPAADHRTRRQINTAMTGSRCVHGNPLRHAGGAGGGTGHLRGPSGRLL